jgi:predicted nucleic acid-binding protein
MSTFLAGKQTCVTFVTIGEMTRWTELQDWGPRNRQRLDLWLSGQVHLGYDVAVARTWGRLAAAAHRRGRTTPVNDTWIAACCPRRAFRSPRSMSRTSPTSPSTTA